MQPSSEQRRLRAFTVPVSSLTASLREDAFALFDEAYVGADPARFEHDLAEKQLVILLRDRATGRLRGFSTIAVERIRAPRQATVLFSGDTVIHRDYWGQKQLQSAFARILLSRKLRAPHRPLYWLLLSKGYRTYMLLANAFPKAVPRCDGPPDPELRRVLDALAGTRYGGDYDAERGIVRFAGVRERVRDGLAPITERHLTNPHVRFFVDRNPRHAEGDELACLADVRLVDLAGIAARLVGARVGRKLRGRAAAPAALDAPRT